MPTFDELIDQQRAAEEPAPEQAQQEAQRILAGDQPLMDRAPDAWVPLARGLREGDRWENQAIVRELTGADEEIIDKYRNDPILFIDALVAVGVEAIGSVNLASLSFEARTARLRELLIGEREQLFIAVSKATFGDEKELNYTCNNCGNENVLDISLSKNIPVSTPTDPQNETYKLTTSKGEIIEYRPLTGEDQFDINSRNKGLTLAEVNTLVLVEAILTVNGRPPVDRRAFALGLSMRDRSKILNDMDSRQPKPDMMMTTECSECQTLVTFPLTWELVFRP